MEPSKASPERKRPEKTTPNDAAMRTRSRSGTRRVGQDPAELVLDVLVLRVVLLAVQLLEGGLVPLVHEEDLALGQHLVERPRRGACPTARG